MFTLIELPYEPDALEPVISKRTLSFHPGKHLKGYVDNLNKLLVGTEFENLGHIGGNEESVLKELMKRSANAIFNNAGQILNHNLYFRQFTPVPIPPAGHLLAQIVKQWGTIESFQAEFVAKGTALFGSGWIWLAAGKDCTLTILQCSGADNPIVHGLQPILTFDVWEHAYYLDWQNRRADHLAALWPLLDWNELERRFSAL